MLNHFKFWTPLLLTRARRYYVRHCSKPKERAGLGLAVRIGSVAEEEHERVRRRRRRSMLYLILSVEILEFGQAPQSPIDSLFASINPVACKDPQTSYSVLRTAMSAATTANPASGVPSPNP